jgi:hypothetical protein
MDKTPPTRSRPRVPLWLNAFYAAPFVCVLGIFGYLLHARLTRQAPPTRVISTQPFATVKIGPVAANFFTQGDQLRAAGNDLFIEFRDPGGQLSDVGDVTLLLQLKMPGMVMHSMGKVFHTATPGQYRTTVDPEVAGDWTAQLAFNGPRGQASAQIPLVVK